LSLRLCWAVPKRPPGQPKPPNLNERLTQMPKIGAGTINSWKADGTGLVTNNLWRAACLACPSIVVFGDKTRRVMPAGLIEGVEWREIERLGQKIDLSHIKEGLNDDILKVFRGAVVIVAGVDLRLRSRALAKHYGGDNFPDDNYPSGPMSLEVDAGLLLITYNKIMDKVKQINEDHK
jgi:hypothetical protein